MKCVNTRQEFTHFFRLLVHLNQSKKYNFFIQNVTLRGFPSIGIHNELLAEDLREPNGLKIGERELLRDGFGDKPYFNVIVAELTAGKAPVKLAPNPDLPSSKMPRNESIVGHVLYFNTFSTWEGRVFHLEDMFVREEYRSQSVGSDLMQECAKIAKATDCARMQCQVLKWNTKTIDTSEKVGAVVLKDWLTLRMTRPTISKFAAGEVSIWN